jgi:di/tricarboxylate transporter
MTSPLHKDWQQPLLVEQDNKRTTSIQGNVSSVPQPIPSTSSSSYLRHSLSSTSDAADTGASNFPLPSPSPHQVVRHGSFVFLVPNQGPVIGGAPDPDMDLPEQVVEPEQVLGSEEHAVMTPEQSPPQSSSSSSSSSHTRNVHLVRKMLAQSAGPSVSQHSASAIATASATTTAAAPAAMTEPLPADSPDSNSTSPFWYARRRCTRMCRAHWLASTAMAVVLVALFLAALIVPDSHHKVDFEQVKSAHVTSWAIKNAKCTGRGQPVSLSANMSSATPQSIDYTMGCKQIDVTWETYATSGVLVVALVLMALNNPPDIVMIGSTVVLRMLGIVNEEEAWEGFSNTGVLAVAVLFSVARAVEEAGTVNALLRSVLGHPRSLIWAQIRLLVPVACISAFVNNTPVVQMMIPITEQWARRIGMSKTKFLMPLSFASLMGGMCTMLGTSTNLVVQGLLKKRDPQNAFEIFDLVYVGVPCACLGILIMAVTSRFLLPDAPLSVESATPMSAMLPSDDKADVDAEYANDMGEHQHHESKRKSSTASTVDLDQGSHIHHERRYDIAFVVPPNSVLARGCLADSGLLTIEGTSLNQIVRQGRIFAVNIDAAMTSSPSVVSDTSVQLPSPSRPVSASTNDEKSTVGNDDTHGMTSEQHRDNANDYTPSNDVQLKPMMAGGITLVDPSIFSLEPGDLLLFSALADSIPSLRHVPGLLTTSDGVYQLGRKRRHRRLVEVVLSRSSPFVGMSLPACEAAMLSRFNAAVVAIRIPPKIASGSVSSDHARVRTSSVDSTAAPDVELDVAAGDTTITTTAYHHTLGVGDALLVEAFPSFIKNYRHSLQFALVREVEGSKPPRRGTRMDQIRLIGAGIVIAVMVTVTALNITTLLVSALAAVAVLIALKCMTIEEAFLAVKARIVLTIVAAFGLGNGLRNSGVASFIANALVNFSVPLGPYALLASISIVTVLVSSVVSNNATVILMFPICVNAVKQVLDVNIRQTMVILMVSASSSFLTPIGYQTNLMVYQPGGYRFGDFTRFGLLPQLGITILSVVLAMALY